MMSVRMSKIVSVVAAILFPLLAAAGMSGAPYPSLAAPVLYFVALAALDWFVGARIGGLGNGALVSSMTLLLVALLYTVVVTMFFFGRLDLNSEAGPSGVYFPSVGALLLVMVGMGAAVAAKLCSLAALYSVSALAVVLAIPVALNSSTVAGLYSFLILILLFAFRVMLSLQHPQTHRNLSDG